MTDVSALEGYAGTLSESAQRSKAASGLQHQIMHGDAQTDVLTESGPVPTLAKQARLYSEAIPDAVTELSAQMTDGKIHDSEEEGRNKVGDGQYFYVKPTNPLLFSRSLFKRISAESSIHIVDDASAASVAKIGETANGVAEKVNDLNSSEVALQVEDEWRFVLLKVLMDGSIDMLNSMLKNSDGNGLEISGDDGFISSRIGVASSDINGLRIVATENTGIEFVDESGFIVGRIDDTGAFFGTVQTAPQEAAQVIATLGQQRRTDLVHIIGYGQSLSLGAFSTPLLSTSQPYGNLMLQGGLSTRPGEPGYNASSFVPLIETIRGVEGETPVSAQCNGFVRRAIEFGERQSDWTLVGTAAGRGGRAVEELMAGSPEYQGLIRIIRDSKALADSMSKTYSVWAYTWDQGEANHAVDTTRSPYQYAQYQLELFDSLTREIVEITRQPSRPHLFTYQVAAHRAYHSDKMEIAKAQWRVSRERADVSLSSPAYIFPTHTDNIHLTNEGSWLMGEYRSRAMFETLLKRGQKWRPLEPVSVEWTTTYIDVEFHVPCGELVLDNTLAATTANFGFDVRENDLVVDILTNVAVLNKKTIRLTLSRPTALNASISYGRGRVGDPNAGGPVIGARGNLRDTHGLVDIVQSPSGQSYALHNACVMFEYSRKLGF